MKTIRFGWVGVLIAACITIAGCEARVNRQRDDFGFLEIHKAARDNDIATVQRLLEKGAKVNLADMDGITPLHTAAKNNFLDLATLLLTHHADPGMTTKDDWDALQLATWKDHAEMVQLLMSYGAVATHKNDRGWTVVHMAAFRGNIGILDIVLRDWDSHKIAGKPSLDELDASGKAPIHIAIEQDHLDMVNYLVTKGENPSIADKAGDTPLHLIIPTGDVERVQFLVMHGADVNARNGNGKTPYDVTVDHQNAAMAQIIWTAGGRE